MPTQMKGPVVVLSLVTNPSFVQPSVFRSEFWKNVVLHKNINSVNYGTETCMITYNSKGYSISVYQAISKPLSISKSTRLKYFVTNSLAASRSDLLYSP